MPCTVSTYTHEKICRRSGETQCLRSMLAALLFLMVECICRPLLDGMLVGADALPLLVRQTAVAANRCCRKQVLGAGYMQPYQTRKKLILDELVGRYSVQYQDGELLSRFLRQDGDDRAALRVGEKRTDAEAAKAKVARTSRLTLNSKRSMSAGSVAESLSRFTAKSSVAEF